MSILSGPKIRSAFGLAFDHPNLLLVCLLGALLLGFTLFKVSGTSVAAYNEFIYGTDYDDPDLLWGQPRRVRSDEWMVVTSMTAAQSHNDFAHFNRNIGLGQEMSLITDAPTDHWSTAFKPHNWSFFVLPLENAIAFKWWFRGFSLVFAAYLLIGQLLVRRGQPRPHLMALAAALILFLTPFVQWWYSTTLLESLTYFCLALYALITLVATQSRRTWLASAALLAFSVCAATLTLYPPFLVPLALLSACLLAGYSAENPSLLTSGRLRLQAAGMLFVAFAVVAILLAYNASLAEPLRTMLNTVYPGARVEHGGSYSLLHFMSGPFNFLLLHSRTVPAELINHSEASIAVFLFPWIGPAALFMLAAQWRRRQTIDYLGLALLGYTGLISLWLLVGLPHPLERVLLLDKVPVARGIVGLVMADLLLVCWFAMAKTATLRPSAPLLVLIATVAFASTLFVGYELRDRDPVFVGNVANIWLGAASAAALIALALLRNKAALMSGLLLFSLFSSLQVNPLYRGLGPLVSSPVLNELTPYREAQPDSRWVVYRGEVYANYLVASGFPVMSGVQVYPQEDLWRQFDPEERYKSEWNRFSHVLFELPQTSEPIQIVSQYVDSFTVFIDPCHPLLKTLGVDYFIFEHETEAPCLQRIAPELKAGRPLYAYRRLT